MRTAAHAKGPVRKPFLRVLCDGADHVRLGAGVFGLASEDRFAELDSLCLGNFSEGHIHGESFHNVLVFR